MLDQVAYLLPLGLRVSPVLPTTFAPALASAWCLHSIALHHRLARRFLTMRLIAGLRPEADSDELAAAASLLPRGTAPADTSRWELTPGSATGLAVSELSPDGWRETCSDDLLVHDGGKGAVRVWDRRPQDAQIEDLVDSTVKRRGGITDDPHARLAWSSTLASRSTWKSAPTRDYKFVFRDYVNYEEGRAMSASRGGLQWLILRMPSPTRLEIRADGTVIMRDTLVGLGVPLSCDWVGKLDATASRVDWELTTARIGWRRFGLLKERPPNAEAIRKAPWLVKYHSSSAAVCLRFVRVGTGSLVFTAPRDAVLGTTYRAWRFPRRAIDLRPS